MDRVCLVVDVDGSNLSSEWNASVDSQKFDIKPSLVSPDEVLPMMETGSVVMMVLVDSKGSKKSFELLDLFREKIGAIPHFQAIVCDEPSPFFITDAYEFGIETFFSRDRWVDDIVEFIERVNEHLNDADSFEEKTLRLNRLIASGDQMGIIEAERQFEEGSDYDYIAAFSKGNALQAVGRYSEASEAFKSSQKLNKYFRPASSLLGESLLITGKTDEAISVFEKLEKSNPRNVERKASLVSAYLEKGEVDKAMEFVKEAQDLDPDHCKVAEAQAQVFLAQGKINDAFKLMDKLHEVGPFFAAKLNEMGIKLSQLGKGKSSLALYAKAHKVVRAELRYKVSLNAALACYRLQDFQKALKYLERSEHEYGGYYEKIEKIRKAVMIGIKKNRGKAS